MSVLYEPHLGDWMYFLIKPRLNEGGFHSSFNLESTVILP